MDRDPRAVMVSALVHMALVAAVVACQQGDRRESSGEVAASLPAHPIPVASADPDVRTAQVELADGRPWLATRRLAGALRSSARRTPEAVLVAARAAAAWEGWEQVEQLLTGQDWVDSQFGGEGLELLARSALERGDAPTARIRAEAALRVPSEPAGHAVRLTLLARALDRLDQRDSAAATYRRAAAALPVVREWLMLRAAGTTADAKMRDRLYASIKGAAPRARVPFTEAQALERFNKLLEAASMYDSVGDRVSAVRLRLEATGDSVARAGLRSDLLSFIQHRARGDDLARALEVLAKEFPTLDRASELMVSRRAALLGAYERAAEGFVRVAPAALSERDVISWARALMAIGKSADAARLIASRQFSAPSAPEAEYLRGHALIRAGQTRGARAPLQHLLSAYGATRQAADALYLLADVETDAGRESNARALYQQACVHAPAGAFSDESCVRAGVIAYALRDARRAAASFDDVATRFPNSPELSAATYWAGRSWHDAGNTPVARQRWLAVLARDRNSYYASAAARRLGVPAFAPPGASIARSPVFQAKLARAATLAQLGMDTEERYEYEAIESEAADVPSMALPAGAALLDRGQASRAIRLGWRALATSRDSGRSDLRAYTIIYPLLRRDAVLAQARANNLDPAIVAGVIRQESSWNPRAVSRAGARGLMQVMPSVGQAIARSRGYPVWDQALLFDPDVSLELGTSHLRAAIAQYQNLPRALAAYNAGDSRVRRWAQRAGSADPELFVERIPFTETRDYVRIVSRNIELYRSLYGLKK